MQSPGATAQIPWGGRPRPGVASPAVGILAVAWYTEPLIVAGAIVTVGAAITVLTGWGRGVARGARALLQGRARRRAIPSAPPEPSGEQARVLNAVYAHFRASGQRVSFSVLDKQLDLEGVHLRPLAESMPPKLLIPDVASRGAFFRDDDKLMVSREGLRYCERGGEALDLLARSLAYLAKREKPFVPSEAQPELTVTSAEIGSELGLTAPQLEQIRLMFDEYEWQARAKASDDGAGAWDVVVATEYVRRFRGIRDGDQYLRAREGESFAHQLDEEEAVPRLTLICDPPTSPAPDSEPVAMRVENSGPTETFVATVEEIICAEHAPTPWNVRWRGSQDEGKEILSGGHWVLDIARQDAEHGANENHWTPGFVFLQSHDKEVFVPHTGLGTTGSRYGVPMRVKIRVTGREALLRPQRHIRRHPTANASEGNTPQSAALLAPPSTKLLAPRGSTAVVPAP